jgi:hypothetical protein
MRAVSEADKAYSALHPSEKLVVDRSPAGGILFLRK